MTTPTNIRDPDIPVTLGAFRALQDEVRRLDDMLRRAGYLIEAADGTNVENEKLVDDYREWLKGQ